MSTEYDTCPKCGARIYLWGCDDCPSNLSVDDIEAARDQMDSQEVYSYREVKDITEAIMTSKEREK